MRWGAALTTLALVVAACGSETATPQSTVPGSVGTEETNGIPRCEDVPLIEVSAETAGGPIYAGNEMPTAAVRRWARQRPAFETIWIDRSLGGWIVVAFSADAADRQAELVDAFPEVGVVAVEVPYRLRDLKRLQRSAQDALGDVVPQLSSGIDVRKGVVTLGVGVVTDEVRQVVAARLPGEPVCLEGLDPNEAPIPGPQPLAGDGWRLLADEKDVGSAYRTGIATDGEGLVRLWDTIGLTTPLPEVDFVSEVVIWFGAVFGSSCPTIRLDDVVIAGDVVHAEVVLVNPPSACTADARAHAYVVAVERSRLPVGPFVVQLDADGPPPGAPEERTVVQVDLSRPSAVATPDDVGADPNLPKPHVLTSGAVVEPGYPMPFALDVRCGIEWLGEVNGLTWRSSTPIPAVWTDLVEDQVLILSIELAIEPSPSISATAGEATVLYEPTTDPIPGCD